jgi:hypothetical protein
MVNDRWTYQVVEVKPRLFGASASALQERLNQLGLQGWELVSVQHAHPLRPVQLYLKKPM